MGSAIRPRAPAAVWLSCGRSGVPMGTVTGGARSPCVSSCGPWVDSSHGSPEQGGRLTLFERFTDRARRVVVLAQEEARLLNHNYIGTEHILLGLIHEGEGVAIGRAACRARVCPYV